MNPAFPDLVYNGILLCLSIQLLILGGIQLYLGKAKGLTLGAICYILGTGFIYTLYWKTFKENIWFSILLANYKHLFYGPLLYLNILILKHQGRFKKRWLTHLIIPSILCCTYSILKHGFSTFYGTHYVNLLSMFLIIELTLLAIYIIFGFNCFLQLKKRIKSKVVVRHAVFYFGLLLYFLSIKIYDGFITFFEITIDFETYNVLSRYIFSPLLILINIMTLFFVITESERFKLLFPQKQTFIDPDIIAGKDLIKQRFETLLFDKKLYKQPNIRLLTIAQQIGINSKTLTEYIKLEYQTNFIDLVNIYRIEEFKRLSKDPNYINYSLLGVAFEAGFSSKATFYRIFKNKEGITPNHYVTRNSKNT